MAKVLFPLFSGDARGDFAKRLIYRRGGVVTRYFRPKDTKSAAQLAHREYFRSYYMAGLTQAQADLLYAALEHLHEGVYSPLLHGHDHGALAGLSDDDHSQYFNQTRGDARYSLLLHGHDHGALTGLSDDDHSQYFNQTRGDARYMLSTARKWPTVFKSVDEEVQGTTTIQQDDELGIELEANKYYAFEMMALFETVGNSGFKYRLNKVGTDGSMWSVISEEHAEYVAGTVTSNKWLSNSKVTATISVTESVSVYGFLRARAFGWTGTGGDYLRFQWAPYRTTNGPTRVKGGSYINYLCYS